jgi:hypothetical protein
MTLNVDISFFWDATLKVPVERHRHFNARTSVLFYPEDEGRGSSEVFVLVLMT